MKADEAIMSESVEAREARLPFRFPRELVIALAVLAVGWQILSMFVPPFVAPGWERIIKSAAGLPFQFVAVTLARGIRRLNLHERLLFLPGSARCDAARAYVLGAQC